MKYQTIVSGLLTLFFTPLFAQGTPWLPPEGSTTVTFSYVHQEAGDFYRGDSKVELSDDLKQSTKLFSINHGLSENLSLDLRFGYAVSDFSPVGDEEGITDTHIGLTWRIVDEAYEDSLPSMAVRLGAILEGNYDTGQINSIGDGSDGVEASFLIGKGFENGFAFNADVGYRYRSSIAPNEIFLNLAGHYSLTHSVTGSVTYQNVNSNGNLDIEGAGFTPSQFPATEEDSESLGLALSYRLESGSSLSLNYGSVIDGRNTSNADFIALSFTAGF